MKRFALILSFILSMSAMAAAPAPAHQWDFTAPGQGIKDTGTATPKAHFPATQDKDGERTAAGGIPCPADSYRNIVCPKQKLDWKTVTLDVQFKLDSALDKTPRTLFNYENKAWHQSFLTLRFNAKNQLEAEIAERKGNVTLRQFMVTSEPLTVEPRAWHNARLTLVSGGEGQLYLDARQVAGKKGAISLSDLDYKTEQWYPLVCFGVDPADPTHKRHFLRGTIQSVRLWDSVQEPNPLFDAPLNASGERDFSHALVTIAGQDTPEWTCPFRVLDSEGALAGSYLTADERFVRTAGKACAVLDGDELVVTFDCPIAPGVDPKKVPNGSVWTGDAVEFFFRPDASKTIYYHYCAGINGATYLARMTAPRMMDSAFKSAVNVQVTDTPEAWKAVFRIPVSEIGLDKTPGTVYSCNFTRSGPAAGGLQTWGPLATDFHQPDSFPPMIISSRKAFFLKRLAQARSRLASLNAAETALTRKATETLAALEKTIETNSDSRDWYSKIDRSFANVENLFTSIALEGKPFLVWENDDPYGNVVSISMLSKPVEKISITMPRNSEAHRGLIFTNMTDKPFLGQIKCFEKWPMQWSGKSFSHEPWNAFLDGIHFYEGLPIMDSAENILYDPLAPLPMNTVIRTGANGTVPLWLTVSSKGLQPGTYTGTIVIKGDYPGFGNQLIPLEVTVLSANPEEYTCINMNFTYLLRTGCHANHAKFLSSRGINTIFASMPEYPEILPDGTIGPVGYEAFDKSLKQSFDNGFDVKTCHLIFYMAMEKKWAMLHKGKVNFPYGTPQFEKAFKLFLKDMVKHLEDTFGLRPEQLIFYPCDEPGGTWNDEKLTMNIAWNTGNWIKEAVPRCHRFIDPTPCSGSRYRLDPDTMDHIFSLFDIVMLYRPSNCLPDIIAAAKKHGCTIWTYGIIDKAVHASVYRRFFWQNLQDGFGSTAAYWHVESHAGGDGFDSFDCSGYNPKERTDYGTLYADWNYGTTLTGRRFEAWCDGFTDYRIAHLCMADAEKRPDKDAILRQLQAIYAKAVQGGIPEMEAARVEILKLYETIK